MRQRLLVTVTGPDHPAVTAKLCAHVAQASAALVDLEQVVVQGRLTLSLVVEIEPGARTALVTELLFEGQQHGLTVDVAETEEAPAPAKVDLVVTLLSPQLSAAHVQVVAERLAEHGAAIERIQRLTETELAALEILCALPAGGEVQPLKRALLDVSTRHGVDVAVQRNTIFRRAKRLVVMDMDSTLIQMEVIDELAKAAGIGAQVAAITARAMQGEMDYDESLRQRVGLLKGLDASHLQRIADDLPLMPGAEQLVRVLRRLGYRTAVISGGFDVPAKALQKKLGLDFAHSNVLEVQDGKLTGRVVGAIVNAQKKADLLEQIARDERISLDQTVAIGDGANDLLMLQKAGLGIAFHGKPKLREAAHTALSGTLDSVLYLLGITARDLRDVA